MNFPSPPPDRIFYPVSLAADSSGKYLYVVNANFDLEYTGGTVTAVDLSENKIIPESTVEVTNFPGEIILYEKNGSPVSAYVPQRGKESLFFMKIAEDPEKKRPVFTCNDNPDVNENNMPICGGEYEIKGEKFIPMGSDPYAAEIQYNSGEPDLLHVGTISQGRISVFSLDETGKPQIQGSKLLGSGINSIKYVKDPSTVYISVRYNQGIIYSYETLKNDKAKPADSENGCDEENQDECSYGEIEIKIKDSIYVIQPVSSGDYVRGMDISEDGTRLYAAYRSPSSLLIYDISHWKSGERKSELAGVVEVGNGASAVKIVNAGARNLAYVPCYYDDRIYVVDTDEQSLFDIIDTDRGPYAIAVIKKAGKPHRAYVANFESHTISVIDIESGSPDYDKVIGTIK
jgi:DNA-binding beta-propeller fold protein YncE